MSNIFYSSGSKNEISFIIDGIEYTYEISYYFLQKALYIARFSQAKALNYVKKHAYNCEKLPYKIGGTKYEKISDYNASLFDTSNT